MNDDPTPCAACGAPLKPGARFCGECGASTPPPDRHDEPEAAEAVAAAEPTPACRACGGPLKPDARFCPGCGALRDAGRAADPARPRSARPGARSLVLGISIVALTLAAGGAGAVAWWRLRDAPAADAPAPPASVAPAAATPVEAVPVAPSSAPPVDPDAPGTAEAAAAADPDSAMVPATRAARRPRRDPPAARPAPRRAPAAGAAAPAEPPPQVLCIRPDGSEVQTSRTACRSQGGVIY